LKKKEKNRKQERHRKPKKHKRLKKPKKLKNHRKLKHPKNLKKFKKHQILNQKKALKKIVLQVATGLLTGLLMAASVYHLLMVLEILMGILSTTAWISPSLTERL